MELTILFLGPARDLAGVEFAALTVAESMTTAGLRDAIGIQFPRIRAGLPAMRIAVNQFFVSDGHVLCNHDEVAVIPPVSGG